MQEVENCPDCYLNAHIKKDSWFTEACRQVPDNNFQESDILTYRFTISQIPPPSCLGQAERFSVLAWQGDASQQ